MKKLLSVLLTVCLLLSAFPLAAAAAEADGEAAKQATARGRMTTAG